MRILQLGRFYPPDLGGIESVIYEITEGLNEKAIRCDVLCSNSTNRMEISKIRGYKVIRTPSLARVLSTSISPAQIVKLRKIIKDYDIIHLHHPDPMATLALLLCNPVQKIVVHWHSDIIRQKMALLFYRPLQSLLLKRSTKIIVTSPNYLMSSPDLGKVKEKCEVIPIGIQANFKVNRQKLLQLKKQFQNKKVIFSLGRHVYYKGLQHLINSAKFLDDNFVIVVGGDGPLTPSLIKLANENDLGKRVFFPGAIPHSDVFSYFEVCDVFCLPSTERSEAFGVVLLEAMSFGKPLVTTSIPGSGVSWVNQHYETGFIVTPEDPRALADAFIQITNSKELYFKFASRSKLRYERHFTRSKMVEQLIELYSKV